MDYTKDTLKKIIYAMIVLVIILVWVNYENMKSKLEKVTEPETEKVGE